MRYTGGRRFPHQRAASGREVHPFRASSGFIGRLRGTQGAFKAVYYRIPAGASTFAIHWLLVDGAQTLEKLTIPEGWTATKIARHLEAQGVCSQADFLAAVRSPQLLAKFGVQGKSLEGYLFPDTYYVPRPFPRTPWLS